MKKTNLLRSFLLILLIAALAFPTFACKSSSGDGGKKTFTFEVYLKGESTPKSTFTVETEKSTVGEALLEKGLIEGEEGPYGLYVKVVDGIRADYDETGTYWSFYINGSYASSGVDKTEIQDGATYSMRVE